MLPPEAYLTFLAGRGTAKYALVLMSPEERIYEKFIYYSLLVSMDPWAL